MSWTDRIPELPDQPGIYIFRGGDGAALYVGKAKSLRKRVPSYLRPMEPRLAAMVGEAVDLEFVVTDTESEALLIENNWIKNNKPRYNVLLRDDKTYPYLKVTMQHDYPKIAFTRKVRNDGADYFGPYLPGGLARKAIKLVQKLFQVRVCHIQIDGKLARPCLYFGMKRCLGPCVDGLTTPQAYAAAVEQTRLFLAGRNDALIKRLKSDMWDASEGLDFETAARLRDTLAEIEAIGQRRKLSSVAGEDVDVFGVYLAGGNAAVVILVMRGGQVLDRRELFWEGVGPIAPERLLDEVLPQLYDRTTFIPKEIHLPLVIEGEEALVEWLTERKGQRVYLRMPARGPKAERVALAMRNARLAHRRRFREGQGDAGAAALREHLPLTEAPRRIEGFDISHFQGGETVASMVVWEEGRILKKDYRSFNIRPEDVPGAAPRGSRDRANDDVRSIRQAVSRRYRRRLEEVGEMPDLVLIDGGRGQLNGALAALAELGVEDTPIVALAKREEEIYLPAQPAPLRLDRSDPGLLLLQRVRDEAHRFALSRHRNRRSKRNLSSRLEDIPGVGPKRRRQLLQQFGSLKGVASASREELAAAVGEKLALRISSALAEDAADEPRQMR